MRSLCTLKQAQTECCYYQEATHRAHEEFASQYPTTAPPFPPCSQQLKCAHYTFDFAQQVTLPHLFRRPGPLYFQTPRKVQLLGVCREGVPKQVNYLLAEADAIGPNGRKSDGAKSVLSLLHDFFRQNGHG